MTPEQYKIFVQSILQRLEEGVHAVDAQSRTFLYNQAMERIEHMRAPDVLGRPFKEVFPDSTTKHSTLLNALSSGKDFEDHQQRYFNDQGKTITALNHTYPVWDQGKIIGAFEISHNITGIRQMTDTLLELHQKVSSPVAQAPQIPRYSFDKILYRDKEFAKMIQFAKKASKSQASVVITGETGTGKEMVAQSIHYEGKRRDYPFIAQNCAALPETLLESLLFGTVRGGFTGALDKKGLFEQATGGTLLLDEINSMPVNLQAKLLRVLQEGYIRRIGGNRDIPVDVRLIATSNQNPQQLMETGQLRKDLFYRLNVIGIEIPPLRQRTQDIDFLAGHFIKKYNALCQKDVWMCSEQALEQMERYDWPGNVRELENKIQMAISLIEEDERVLSPAHLKLPTLKRTWAPEAAIDPSWPLPEQLQEYEKRVIVKTYEKCQGNVSAAARELGISRQRLQYKLDKYR